MQTLIKLTGSFMLIDPYTRQAIDPYRPHVVKHTPFMDSRIAARQVKVLNADLTDEATDAEFAVFWADSEGDEALAVASFVSKFTEGSEPEKPAPKKRGKAAASTEE